MKVKISLSIILLLISTILYAQTTKKTVRVEGLCGMCEERIENAALEAGAKLASWDAETNLLVLEFNQKKTSLENIQRNIAKVGHDTEDFKADDEVYNALPGCCKYRDNLGDIVHPLRGQVLDAEDNPLPGASLHWEGTTEGVATDDKGLFTINQVDEHILVVNYIGFQQDTIDIGNGRGFLTIRIGGAFELNEVEIVKKRISTSFSFSTPIKTETIGEKELQRAACCNLSQSFETNPSVDVSSTDAVTGARQIELLGLSGQYIQITTENIPGLRGLNVVQGLGYIPGTWIESIQVGKGSGSVVNGFESIAGQINIELKKPDAGEKLLANIYTNDDGGVEGNLNFRQKLNEQWSTAMLFHGSSMQNVHDKNKDGFADMPTSESFIFSNRWIHKSDKGWSQRFGVELVNKNTKAGQLAKKGAEPTWIMSGNNKGYRAYSKLGKVFERKQTSLGFQFLGEYNEQMETFGHRTYEGKQHSFYANMIYQSYLGTINHQYKAGLSFQYDKYDEQLDNSNYDRIENVPGAFLEYTYSPSDKLDIVAGLRADYHNSYGFFTTPRLHIKYQPYDKTSFRLSAGKGFRTANVLTEHKGALASSRALIFHSENTDTPYGLEQERAWNYGLNFTQGFSLWDRDAIVNFDVYRTEFSSKVIADYDQDVKAVHFYNLNGDSYANSLQVQFDYELIKNVDIRLAYRLYDVQETYSGKTLRKPLQAKHRGFVNLNYTNLSGWGINLTTSLQSKKRLADFSANPIAYQKRKESPSFSTTNLQLSKTWDNRWDIYGGIENLFDYKEENPIVAADIPFSKYFDSTQVWGPVKGRLFYFGVRYRLLP